MRPIPSFESRDALAVNDMFAKISSHYDKLNTLLTFGQHHRWKQHLVKWSTAPAKANILDCATGTGDIAFRFERTFADTRITGLDPCLPLLEIAREKAKRANSKVTFLEGDMMKLPFADGEFDVVSISFGLRNAADPIKALQEIKRVLKPGGQLLILESGAPQSAAMYLLWSWAFRKLLEPFGNWVSDTDAYTYLRKSSETFPYGRFFVEEIEKLHLFSNLEYRTFFGSCYLYRCTTHT